MECFVASRKLCGKANLSWRQSRKKGGPFVAPCEEREEIVVQSHSQEASWEGGRSSMCSWTSQREDESTLLLSHV